ncbi:MAG TPA: Hpt domain-containing protein [Candidatus Kapabacteria bacterium]|nr:Hpt domain-containing protein [Candidatus Kapabacteria bacterium]
MKLPEDPFILELLPEFIDSWLDELTNKFPDLMKTRNDTELYRMAHTMKGSCYQFGLNEIGDIGVELMNMIKNKEWDNVESKCNYVLSEFVKYHEYLQKNS